MNLYQAPKIIETEYHEMVIKKKKKKLKDGKILVSNDAYLYITQCEKKENC